MRFVGECVALVVAHKVAASVSTIDLLPTFAAAAGAKLPSDRVIDGVVVCPCHGSHYDMAGRIRKGPAPRNLPVPVAKFENETTIKLG